MPCAFTTFPSTALPINVERLAAHTNAVPCLLLGRTAAVTVAYDGNRIEGDVLLVRPGFEHNVACRENGATVLYLDGLRLPPGLAAVSRLDGPVCGLAYNAAGDDNQARAELRARLSFCTSHPIGSISNIIADLVDDPMERMAQGELSERLGAERTSALRQFKSATGMTFRAYKRWAGLQFATKLIMAGETVRTAAMDAGFSDTAHLSRTFRATFGLTPSEAAASLVGDVAIKAARH